MISKYLTYYVVLLYLVLACTADKPTMDITHSDKEVVHIIGLDTTYTAGKEIAVTILFDETPVDSKYLLLWSNGLQESLIELEPSGNQTEFVIPRALSNHKAIHQLSVLSNDQILAQAELNIVADEPFGEADCFSGPRTIWPYGEQAAMVTTIFKDSMNNAVNDHQLVSYNLSDYSRDDIVIVDRVNHQFSSIEFYGDNPEKVIIGAQSGIAATKEQEILIIQDGATDFDIQLVEHISNADSRQYSHVKTDQIKDHSGHLVADGSLVTFRTKDRYDQVSSYQSQTLDGIAHVFIQNPSLENTLTVTAQADNVESVNAITLLFESEIQNYRLLFRNDKDILKIGNFRYQSGQLLPNGIMVEISIERSGSTRKIGAFQIIDGFVNIDLVEYSMLQKRPYKLVCKLKDQTTRFRVI